MGLLILGSTLSWEETKKLARYVRQSGAQQFVHMFSAHRNLQSAPLVWGDEVEYTAVYLDDVRNEARVALVASALLPSLEGKGGFLWSPEFGDHMIEGIPGAPFSSALSELLQVELSLRKRRECLTEALSAVNPNIVPLTMPAFPRLGCSGFTEPRRIPAGEFGKSFFIPDDMINQHSRFRMIEQNIRERKGERVAINIPMYLDTHTDREYFTRQLLRHGDEENPALPGHVYMDSMGFGMSNCCLQMTYQTANLDQARYLYDQLSILGPLLVCLTNSAPAFHGFLSDNDCRFPVIEQSVDDRTPQERTNSEASGHLPNSRYSVIDCFIATDKYNDIPVPIDQETFDILADSGVDALLSRHVAHLFTRDPLLLYSQTLETDNSTSSVHFENLNSSNWNNVRLKPPPISSDMGWRVEFRPIDLQLTDFENSCFMILTNLLIRVLIRRQINLYVPISKMQENFRRSFVRDSCRSQQLFFRRDIFSADQPEVALWDVDTIVNGKTGEFIGLLPLVREYLDSCEELTADQIQQLHLYLDLVRDRASGELMTGANWTREFILSHPSYKNDSVVCEQICYDLCASIHKISRPNFPNSAPELTGIQIPSNQFFLLEDEL